MAENWGKKHLPHQNFIDKYGVWADAEWGLIMSGNLQVDVAHLGLPEDITVGDATTHDAHVAKWKKWSAVETVGDAVAVSPRNARCKSILLHKLTIIAENSKVKEEEGLYFHSQSVLQCGCLLN